MEWWMWILLGLVLFWGEIVTPGGFYVIFFGVGAIVVGILAGFNAAGPSGFNSKVSTECNRRPGHSTLTERATPS